MPTSIDKFGYCLAWGLVWLVVSTFGVSFIYLACRLGSAAIYRSRDAAKQRKDRANEEG